MSKEIIWQRLNDFEGPIKEASINNTIVNECIHAYAHGSIITKEECLSRMVVLLTRDWKRECADYVSYQAYVTQNMVKPI